MNKINLTFDRIEKSGKTAFMPFLVAGHPNSKLSLSLLTKLSKHADLLEIGFPYSDPLADGPVIQAADTLALKNGITTQKVFDLIRKLRKETDVPITVLVYANLVYQYGIEKFYRQASRSGIDGVLIPDVPIEESGVYVKAAKRFGIAPIFLVTQTTTPPRLKKILSQAEGFLYLVSILGVTGARKKFKNDTLKFIRFIKAHSHLPVAVGFGISGPGQITELKRVGASGVIVGSALVKSADKPRDLLKLAKELKHAC